VHNEYKNHRLGPDQVRNRQIGGYDPLVAVLVA